MVVIESGSATGTTGSSRLVVSVQSVIQSAGCGRSARGGRATCSFRVSRLARVSPVPFEILRVRSPLSRTLDYLYGTVCGGFCAVESRSTKVQVTARKVSVCVRTDPFHRLGDQCDKVRGTRDLGENLGEDLRGEVTAGEAT